jgi:hypothetical protein
MQPMSATRSPTGATRSEISEIQPVINEIG